ncbi:NTE family protein [Lishizhenia tianjinensis]|uniref:NTE family protein n=1 Tax=Lishizhenia tianjinensis TaxID=477690 RepID=A0A1I6XLW1_9FLAO|nr:patatin-like phospholipase family protein [Lishizhenia tianjinensis]SFT39042.1 NTE family protein [Lishizhenia tianjinensis]
MYENLVFKGGGVLGMAYAGAIDVLEEKGLLSNIQRVAGTSAGALTALSLCLGYTANDLKELMAQTNFKKFQKETNYLKITHDYGLYKGNFLLTWIKEIIAAKDKDPEMTFKDLNACDCWDLKVFACNLNTTGLQEFSFEQTPHIKIAEAIRASMSIPFFFNAWQFPNGDMNKHIFIDGGVLYNYPISAFDNLDKTLGLYINTEDKDEDLGFDQIGSYIKRLFKAVLKGQDMDMFKSDEVRKRTIFLDNLHISSTHFDITKEEQESLFNKAKELTENFCSKL